MQKRVIFTIAMVAFVMTFFFFSLYVLQQQLQRPQIEYIPDTLVNVKKSVTKITSETNQNTDGSISLTTRAKASPASEPGVFNPLNVIEISSKEPRIQLYENFVTEEECEYIKNLAISKGLQRSEVASKTNIQSEVRTSYGLFLTEHRTDPVLSRINERIGMWTHLPAENGEPYYFLRYEKGQEYKPHFDYFDPAIEGMSKYLGEPGQRTATVLIYLNEEVEGGETIFPNAKPNPISVSPTKGSAALFWSLNVNNSLDTYSLHGSLPVIQGTKYCCTKWIRENKYPY